MLKSADWLVTRVSCSSRSIAVYMCADLLQGVVPDRSCRASTPAHMAKAGMICCAGLAG
jgi:hypothetical protein